MLFLASTCASVGACVAYLGTLNDVATRRIYVSRHSYTAVSVRVPRDGNNSIAEAAQCRYPCSTSGKSDRGVPTRWEWIDAHRVRGGAAKEAYTTAVHRSSK